MLSLRFSRRTGRLTSTQTALVFCSAAGIVLLHSMQFGYAEGPGSEPSRAVSGKLESVRENDIVIIAPGADVQTLRVSANASVMIAGAKRSWDDLKKGDYIVDSLSLVGDGGNEGHGHERILLKKTGPVDRLTLVFGEEVHDVQISRSARVHLDGQMVDWSRVQSGSYLITGLEASKPNQVVYDHTTAKIRVNGAPATAAQLRGGDQITIVPSPSDPGAANEILATRLSIGAQFWENFRKNLFKPLLLFFYMGFAVPLLGVAFEFPHAVYQGLTIYLLIAIGWHGGEELADLSGSVLTQALLFMLIGFATNFVIGIIAYGALRATTGLRRIDAATVGAYYGSDSAGTFVTCIGVLTAANIAYAAYMPVMLAVMEIPGCLVGLYLVSQLRRKGMDPLGNMPDEAGYDPKAKPDFVHADHGVEREKEYSLEDQVEGTELHAPMQSTKTFNLELLREVFLNPGLFLLFGGIVVGFISRLQGHKVTDPDDSLFITLFQGLLCLFLLEMGMTACRRLKDLRTAGWRYIAFGLIAPNVFATLGMLIAHGFSLAIGQPLELGTYVLFAVLCAAASYIAVPAVQRLAIPEASPTLPLAASLGLTFSYNVTIGIPVYIEIAKLLSGGGHPS